KIKTQQGHGTREENGVRPAGTAIGLRIDKQRFVVAPLYFPLLDGFLADTLAANRETRHVVGGIDRKKQDKRQQVNAQQNEHPIQQAAHNIADHDTSVTGRVPATARSRFRAVRHRTTTPNTATAANSQDRKSTRLNSSHVKISYAVFCSKKNKQ